MANRVLQASIKLEVPASASLEMIQFGPEMNSQMARIADQLAAGGLSAHWCKADSRHLRAE